MEREADQVCLCLGMMEREGGRVWGLLLGCVGVGARICGSNVLMFPCFCVGAAGSGRPNAQVRRHVILRKERERVGKKKER